MKSFALHLGEALMKQGVSLDEISAAYATATVNFNKERNAVSQVGQAIQKGIRSGMKLEPAKYREMQREERWATRREPSPKANTL